MSDVEWVAYGKREGPMCRGAHPHAWDMPTSSARLAAGQLRPVDVWLAAAMACEGGCYDAVNMYDRGIVSVGLLQWSEVGWRNLSRMLDFVVRNGGDDAVRRALTPALELTGARISPSGFSIIYTSQNGRGCYDSAPQGKHDDSITKELFLGCDGFASSWTPAARRRALVWAECFRELFQNDDAREIQRRYATYELNNFVFPRAREILFDRMGNFEGTPMLHAVRAVYVSMAVNAPGIAQGIVEEFSRSTKIPARSEKWCLSLLSALASTSSAPQFSRRYALSRPIAAAAFNVDLPEDIRAVKTVSSITVFDGATRASAPPPASRAFEVEPIVPRIIELQPMEISGQLPRPGLLSTIASLLKLG